MKFAVLALLATVSATEKPALSKRLAGGPCRKQYTAPELRGPDLHAGEPLEWVPLPRQAIWNDIEGVNYLTEIKNQHIPQYCGSCWAQAATSSLSDRIKIARKAAWPDVNIAPQVLISCSGDDGCHGGEAYNALEWMYHNQVTDETCAIYQARGHDNGVGCSQQLMCNNCAPGSKGCWAQDDYKYFHTERFGHVAGEQAMLQELYQRGPIACGIVASQKLDDYKGGIFNDSTPWTPDDINHDISVVGFGEENGVKFWTIRNSWGSAWGEQGFFRLIRGTNNIMIETDCAWGVPMDTWTNDMRHHLTEAEKKDVRKPSADIDDSIAKDAETFLEKPVKRYGRHTHGRSKITPLLPEVLPLDDPNAAPAPLNWDWRNVNGTNWVSWNKNQHIPVYCGSCWAQATTSSLADRFNIMLGMTGSATPVGLNAQHLVNFEAGKSTDPSDPGPGDCNGGDPLAALKWISENGSVDSSCQQYVAKNFNGTAGPYQICKDCVPPVCPEQNTTAECQAGCSATTPVRMYYVSSYRNFSGKAEMQAELVNGPIECGIEATDEFDEYKGGIYHQRLGRDPQLNHAIAVVGWGRDPTTQLDYWIGRNSWGTYWGEGGFFRMLMDGDDLGITTDCTAGTPSFTKPALKKENIDILQ